MEFTVGSILDGKVKSIAKFGAFVTLPGGKTGLVHISEVANTFVNDIHEYLTEGQDVQVKVISMDAEQRISLSIKQAQPAAPKQPSASSQPAAPRANTRTSQPRGRAPARQTGEMTFEEKLKVFMSESDSKIAGLKQYSDRRTRSRRR